MPEAMTRAAERPWGSHADGRPSTPSRSDATYFRFFHIAGINVRVESDFNLFSVELKREFTSFCADGPGGDNVVLRHVFDMPDFSAEQLGAVRYRKAPWIISEKNGCWFYRGVSSEGDKPDLHRVAVFAPDYSAATIYSPKSYAEHLKTIGWHSLSLLPTDQIWLAPLLADRSAAILHSSAVVLNGRGLMFVGHSSAGKSTTVTMLKDRTNAEILCDDRNIARRWQSGWRVHGTWSHGDVAEVSSASAPLHAILFLKQDERNDLVPLTDRRAIWPLLLSTMIKPLATAEWWQKELGVIERMIDEVPCYMMHFDKSGKIVSDLQNLTTRSLLPLGAGQATGAS